MSTFKLVRKYDLQIYMNIV